MTATRTGVKEQRPWSVNPVFSLLWSKFPQVASKSEGIYREPQPPSDNKGLWYLEWVYVHTLVPQTSIDMEMIIILHIYINTYKRNSYDRLRKKS